MILSQMAHRDVVLTLTTDRVERRRCHLSQTWEAMNLIRDALFEHEMFFSRTGNTSFGMNHVLGVEQTWEFSAAEIELELRTMLAEGLVVLSENGHWTASMEGRKIRERRWQELGRRHLALLDHANANLEDLVLALVVCTGHEFLELAWQDCPRQVIYIHLWFRSEAEVDEAIASCIENGQIFIVDPVFSGNVERLAATAIGKKDYARVVVPRLGLDRSSSILSASTSEMEHSLFGKLNLPDVVFDNLCFRWEEAERCRAAGAWLALAILHGSILEALLAASLELHADRAWRSSKAPRDKKGASFREWRLEAMLNVAADIGLVEPTLARYGHVLRDVRNLVHPNKQIAERSMPDDAAGSLSGQVLKAVIESLSKRQAPEALK